MQDHTMPHEVQAVRGRRKILRRSFRRSKWWGLAALAGIASAVGVLIVAISAPQPSSQSASKDSFAARNAVGVVPAVELATQQENAPVSASTSVSEQDEAEAQRLAEEQSIAAAREQEFREARENAAAEAFDAAAEKARADTVEVERRKRSQALRVQLANTLAKAVLQLDQGQLDEAEASLDEAATLDRNDATLRTLRGRWRAALIDAQTPVSDSDFDQVIENFDRLRRALENKDVATMESLTTTSDQNALFRQLMLRFTSLAISIKNIRVRNADKTISATLRIDSMVRDNGDRATPSPAYRERVINSQRTEGKWSLIQW